MRAAWLVAALVLPSSVGASESEFASARAALVRGIELRADAARAKPEFARAADRFDLLWRQGFKTLGVARLRARAHWLAGNLPLAILALREGLAIEPADRGLQQDLESARRAVAYPAGSELDVQCRVKPTLSLATLLTTRQAIFLGGALWIVACLAVTRYLMTREQRTLVIAASLAVAFVLFAGLWWRANHEIEREALVAVLVEDAILREGNAMSFAPRLEAPLPQGVEVGIVGERGGWLHVELAGGLRGWLPGEGVIVSTASR